MLMVNFILLINVLQSAFNVATIDTLHFLCGTLLLKIAGFVWFKSAQMKLYNWIIETHANLTLHVFIQFALSELNKIYSKHIGTKWLPSKQLLQCSVLFLGNKWNQLEFVK